MQSVRERREYIELTTKTHLAHIGSFSLDESVAAHRHCEQMIGVAQVPMGIAGPLRIRFGQSQKDYYIPLATTEGTLVASVSRGCRAIFKSGGVSVYAHRVGTTRGPVFSVRSLEENSRLYRFVKEHHDLLKKTAEKTSAHLTYKKAEMSGVASYAYIRFYFETGDAMGMNMATIATQKLVELIEEKTSARCISLAGNYDSDKKPAWLNVIGKRGWKAWAEIEIPRDIVQKVLKVTPEAFYKTWLTKCMVGSALSGSMGFNAHIANVIAALFIATGQDPAHVVEGSLGMTIVEVRGENLYVSVYLPSLMIGTVGGGTSLATQREALSIMGVAGSGKVAEFALVVIGAVLAGEVSLLASLAEGSLAEAHERLARGHSFTRS